jgi:hypothetical protein
LDLSKRAWILRKGLGSCEPPSASERNVAATCGCACYTARPATAHAAPRGPARLFHDSPRPGRAIAALPAQPRKPRPPQPPPRQRTRGSISPHHHAAHARATMHGCASGPWRGPAHGHGRGAPSSPSSLLAPQLPSLLAVDAACGGAGAGAGQRGGGGRAAHHEPPHVLQRGCAAAEGHGGPMVGACFRVRGERPGTGCTSPPGLACATRPNTYTCSYTHSRKRSCCNTAAPRPPHSTSHPTRAPGV